MAVGRPTSEPPGDMILAAADDIRDLSDQYGLMPYIRGRIHGGRWTTTFNVSEVHWCPSTLVLAEARA